MIQYHFIDFKIVNLFRTSIYYRNTLTVIFHDPFTARSNEETFLQDFLVILKHTIQNYQDTRVTQYNVVDDQNLHIVTMTHLLKSL